MSIASTSASAASMTVKQLRKSVPLVDRFLLRQRHLQALVQEHGVHNVRSQRGSLINPLPTQCLKNQHKQRWLKPRLSIRRQAQLGKAAYAEGRFDELVQEFKNMKVPLGAKLQKMQLRIREGERAQQRQAKALQDAANSTDASVSTSTQAQAAASQHASVSRQQADEQARRLALALASHHGPYRGRSPYKLFKGTLAERRAPARKLMIEERMGKMDQTIANWRAVRKEARTKAQPKLPF